ncbi:MAG: YeeE/YedE family protein [Anaerolineae bacterium]|nr:YeeE/YedE family protein [Anaerolineae bacterium]
MAPFPLPLESLLGHWGQYIIYFGIGILFGWVLETAGFSRSSKLAAQFYLKDMTVLKVMFTGIVVAMLFIFLTSGLGLLDYNVIWVNPTYLWPGIVGGLIMGFGFIIGGFCPGTSIVATATGKIDGLIFLAGCLFGIFAFGETVGLYESWWNSSYLGRFTLMDMFNTSNGVIVVGVVVLALGAFAFAEVMERTFGKNSGIRFPRWRFATAAGGITLALIVAAIGQPTTADKWARLENTKGQELTDRAVQIEPAELLSLKYDDNIKLVMLDVRSEADYNRFHIADAQHLDPRDISAAIKDLHLNPSNTAVVLISNDEAAATDVWKILVAEAVPNVYILGGGVNQWITTFADDQFKQDHPLLAKVNNNADRLDFSFAAALGSRYTAADPNPEAFAELPFEKKVKLAVGRVAKGGCG